MPNITIYLPNDLYDFVKKNSPSKIIQEALREYKKKNEGKHV